MNRAIIVASALFLLSTNAQSSPALATQNRLSNAGAEAGITDAPAGWVHSAVLAGVSYVWDRNVAHTGTASLCLRKTAARYFPVAQWSQAIPYTASGGSVTVSAWVKAQDMTKAVIDVQFMDGSGKWLSHQWIAYIGAKAAGDAPVTHDWQLYTATIPVPAGTKQVVVAPQIYGPGTVWFDDLDAEYVP